MINITMDTAKIDRGKEGKRRKDMKAACTIRGARVREMEQRREQGNDNWSGEEREKTMSSLRGLMKNERRRNECKRKKKRKITR